MFHYFTNDFNHHIKKAITFTKNHTLHFCGYFLRKQLINQATDPTTIASQANWGCTVFQGETNWRNPFDHSHNYGRTIWDNDEWHYCIVRDGNREITFLQRLNDTRLKLATNYHNYSKPDLSTSCYFQWNPVELLNIQIKLNYKKNCYKLTNITHIFLRTVQWGKFYKTSKINDEWKHIKKDDNKFSITHSIWRHTSVRMIKEHYPFVCFFDCLRQ